MRYNYLLYLKAFKQKFNYSTNIFFYQKNNIKLFFFLLKKFIFIIKNIEKLPNFTYKNYIFFKNSLNFNFLNFFNYFIQREKKNHYFLESFDFFDESKTIKIINRTNIEKKFWMRDKIKKKYKKYNYSLNKFKILKANTKFNEYWNSDIIKEGYDALWNRYQFFNQEQLWGTPVIRDKLLLYRAKMNDSDGMGHFNIFARQKLNKSYLDNKKKNPAAKVLKKKVLFSSRRRLKKKKLVNWTRKITYDELMRYNKFKREIDAIKAIEKIENEKRRIGMEKAKAKEDRWEIVKNDVFIMAMNRRYSSDEEQMDFSNNRAYFSNLFIEWLLFKQNEITEENDRRRSKAVRRCMGETKHAIIRAKGKKTKKNPVLARELMKTICENLKLLKTDLRRKKRKRKLSPNFHSFRKYLLKLKNKNIIIKRLIQLFSKKYYNIFSKKEKRRRKIKNKKSLNHTTIILEKLKDINKVYNKNTFFFYYNLKKLLPKYKKVYLKLKRRRKSTIRSIKLVNPWLRIWWVRSKKNNNIIIKNKAILRLIKRAKHRKLVNKFEQFNLFKFKINRLKFHEKTYLKLKLKYKKSLRKKSKIKNNTLNLFNIIPFKKFKNYKKAKKKFYNELNDIYLKKTKNSTTLFPFFNTYKNKNTQKKEFNFHIYNLFLKDKFKLLLEKNINKNLFFKKNLKEMGYKPYFIDYKKNLDMKYHIINIYNIIKRGSLVNGGQFIFTTHNIIENMNLFYQYQYEKWILKLLFMKNTYFRWFSTYISNTPFMSFGAKYFFDQQKLALVNIVKPTLLDLTKFKSLLVMNRNKKNFNVSRSINTIVHNYFYKIFYINYSIIFSRFSFKTTGKIISNYLMQLVKTVKFEAIRPDFIIEFINVCALTFFSKDPKPLVKWIIKVINKISHKKHWKFLFLLKINVLRLAYKFAKETNFSGFHLRIRGKIGALGSVRKKIVHIKMGEYGFSKYYLKGDIYYLSATTMTGKIGVKMIICYK